MRVERIHLYVNSILSMLPTEGTTAVINFFCIIFFSILFAIAFVSFLLYYTAI